MQRTLCINLTPPLPHVSARRRPEQGMALAECAPQTRLDYCCQSLSIVCFCRVAVARVEWLHPGERSRARTNRGPLGSRSFPVRASRLSEVHPAWVKGARARLWSSAEPTPARPMDGRAVGWCALRKELMHYPLEWRLARCRGQRENRTSAVRTTITVEMSPR
jgi:hypothetical protein